MTVYCGVDFHARKQTISYLTTEDGEVQQAELHHEQDNIRGFYTKLRNLGPVIVGLETSGYAAWFGRDVGRAGLRDLDRDAGRDPAASPTATEERSARRGFNSG